MSEQKITAEMKVSRVVKEHPETIEAFLGHGCPDMRKGIFPIMARIMNVKRAAWIHKIPLEGLLRDLNESVTRSNVDTEDLREMLDKGKPVTVLDIRPAEERAEWAIPGSVHVDAYDALRSNDQEALVGVDLPKDAPVITVCALGVTSATAAQQLRARGFEARSLSGGMKAWSLAWNTAEVPVPGSDVRVIQVRRTGKGCLSYVIGSEGEAAVIDAALEPDVYMDLASKHGWTITSVLETHVHADHLSRSRRLAELAGATLYLPDQDRVSYPFTPVRDTDLLEVGAAKLTVMSTSGHTPESTCYLLDDQALLTGDTLSLSGVGRPDLEANPEEARVRAYALYRSLERILALPPETLVLPGHTGEPVAFDGKPLAGTLAEAREKVGLLRMPEDDFIETISSRIPPAPPNHHRIVRLNEAGTLPEGDPTELEAGANRCAVS